MSVFDPLSSASDRPLAPARPDPLLITFATAAFTRAAETLAATAAWHGLECRIYTPAHPVVARLRRTHPLIANASRGAGYWLWKPHIIRHALEAHPGRAVLYVDAGAFLYCDPAPLLGLADHWPVVLFEQEPHNLQRHWTKRDCFVYLDADTPAHWDTPQLAAGFQLYRSGPEALAFVGAVVEAMADPRVVTDNPNTCRRPNLPGYVAHRHDQSVLTIVARKHACPVFPDPSVEALREPRPARPDQPGGIVRPAAPYARTFFLHRMRNPEMNAWLLRERQAGRIDF